jgi:hypothetical protein
MSNLFRFLVFSLLIATSFSACNNDPCKDIVCIGAVTCVDGICQTLDPCINVVCGEQGICMDGICICDFGYEKDAANLCNIEQRAKFLGGYDVADSCSTSGISSYTTAIAAGTVAINSVEISNFWAHFSNPVIATVSGNTITIARQQPDGGNYFVEGMGTINGNTLTFTYTITNETNPSNIITDTCNNVIWTKN